MKGAVVTGSVAADLREVTGGAELGLARDRVAQAYLGEWGGARTIERVRNRIHWLAAAVRGTTVLDVGTSEGILPILLAREGFRAHGIDTNAGAIAFARTLVAAEAEAVRERITLVEESLVDHAPAAPYDTVVVGEVIEHVGNPAGFVDRALALVAEGGRLVLTTPYGILPDRDHRHSLYLSDIRDLAATRGTVEALDVVDGYIRLVLRKGAVATDADHAGLLSERRLLALSEDAAHAAGVVLHHGLDELRGAVSGLSEDLAAAGGSLSEALAAQAGVEAELVASRDERTRLAAAVADRDRTIESLRAEEARLVRRIAEAQAMATARESEAKADRARIAGLERILAGVRAGVAAAVPEGERIALVHPSHGPTIALAFEPVTFAVAPVPGRYLEIRIVFAEGGMPRDRRDSVVLVRCLDAAGAVIAPPYRGLQFSPKTGAYRYLDPARVEAGVFRFGFQPPAGTARIEIGLRRFAKDGAAVTILNRVALADPGLRAAARKEDVPVPATPMTVAAAAGAARETSAPPASAYRVATVLDEFSFGSFGPEFDAVPLDPKTWRESFERHRPQLFFCESAWSGIDPVRRPWKGQVYGSVRFPKENRTALLAILEHCRREGIPTIFWNKEDPTHFPDRVHDFVDTAKRFDVVFTTAAECVEGYRREHGCRNVFALPFATQPRLFNPIETGPRSSNIVFAGSWYAQHRQRSIDMEAMLDRLVEDGFTLEIIDRHAGNGDPNHRFPDRYHPFIRPGVPHDQMAAVYKSSRFGLNFNTVIDSPTMFARRVFELMSSNTLVVSNHARGIEEMFGDMVVFPDREPGRLKALDVGEIDAMRERALAEVLAKHTYRHRWEEILRNAGFAFTPAGDALTVVVPVASRDEAQGAIRAFEARNYADARLLLLVAAEVPDVEVPLYYEAFNRFGVTVTATAYIDRYAPERRIPIDTPNAILARPDALPPRAWVERAIPHLAYAGDLVMSAASGGGDRYRSAAGRKGEPLLARSARLAGLVSGAPPETVYYV